MRYELKTIGIWAFIRVAFILNLLAGFVAGLFCIPFMALFMAAMETTAYMDEVGMGADDGTFGFLVVGLPVIISLGAAIVGTFFETIVIVLYNVIARLVGGLEVTLDPVAATPQASNVHIPAPPPRPETPPPPPPPPTVTDIPPQRPSPPPVAPTNRPPDQDLEKP